MTAIACKCTHFYISLRTLIVHPPEEPGATELLCLCPSEIFLGSCYEATGFSDLSLVLTGEIAQFLITEWYFCPMQKSHFRIYFRTEMTAYINPLIMHHGL